MAGYERSGIISIPFESGVTVDVEKSADKVVGAVWSISEAKPQASDIDLAVSLVCPETYVSWLSDKSRNLRDDYIESTLAINKIIETCPYNSQEVVDMAAKLSRNAMELE